MEESDGAVVDPWYHSEMSGKGYEILQFAALCWLACHCFGQF
jgi:hypothetical protein